MVQIVYSGKTFTLQPGQDVLSALLDHDVEVPHNCRAGACQSCLMKAIRGNIPAEAQQGLKPTLVEQGYFLACRCQPRDDMEITLAAENALIPATVLSKDLLSDEVLRLRLSPESKFNYHAGQYTNLLGNDTSRSYSIASLPSENYLEFHIRHIEGGQLSPWLFNKLGTGEQLQLQSAMGSCFYVSDDINKPIILIGTGTGLAPLYGIARDALYQGHRGEIHLIHGSVYERGLYLHNELQQLANNHDNFNYYACVLENENSIPSVIQANIETLAFGVVEQASDWQIYLCGDPGMVNSLKKRFFLAGAAMNNIYTDPFIIGTP